MATASNEATARVRIIKPDHHEVRPTVETSGRTVVVHRATAESWVARGLATWCDTVRLRATRDGVQLANHVCTAGQIVDVPDHLADGLVLRGLAERA